MFDPNSMQSVIDLLFIENGISIEVWRGIALLLLVNVERNAINCESNTQ